MTPQIADRLDTAQALAARAQGDAIFQRAVALHYLRDCSHKDIADILEVPIPTVKSRIARGLAPLKSLLSSAGEVERGRTAWD